MEEYEVEKQERKGVRTRGKSRGGGRTKKTNKEEVDKAGERRIKEEKETWNWSKRKARS